MRPFDTSQAAHEVQIRLYRAMKDEQRSGLALRMSDDAREISRGGIRARHPDYSEEQVKRALVALLYGADAAAKVWPGLPVSLP
jgi:Rv0078B-related antitoxin